MRKITLFAIAAMLSAAVSAQTTAPVSGSGSHTPRPATPQTALTAAHSLPQSSRIISSMKLTGTPPAPAQAAQTATRTGTADGIITEVPAGRHVMHSKSGYVWYVYEQMFVLNQQVSDLVGEAVYGDDGCVYFKNPFGQYPTDTYLKGTVEGDEVVVELPQPITEVTGYDGQPVTYYAMRMLYNEEGGVSMRYQPDETCSEIRYRLRGDTIVWDEDSTGDVILGLATDDGQWLYYGDYGSTYVPMTDTAVTPPDGLEAGEWTFEAGSDRRIVKVGFDGSDVYVGSIYADMPDCWVKGKRNGSTVSFASGQYLGADATTGYHAYMLTAGLRQEWSDEYEMYLTSYAETDSIFFSFDEAAMTMAASTSNDSTIIINRGKDIIYSIATYDAPVMTYQEPLYGAVAPATPVITHYEPFDPNVGYAYMNVSIPDTTSTGRLLDVNRMHYNLFIDDELFTFYPDEYFNLTEPMTDVPYKYDDDYDIYYRGMSHGIYIYTTGYDKIGVRSTYTAENGDTADSEIGWYYLTPTGITAPAQTSGDVKGISYTDLTGRKVSRPAKGLYIETVTYADGTIKSYKKLYK